MESTLDYYFTNEENGSIERLTNKHKVTEFNSRVGLNPGNLASESVCLKPWFALTQKRIACFVRTGRNFGNLE